MHPPDDSSCSSASKYLSRTPESRSFSKGSSLPIATKSESCTSTPGNCRLRVVSSASSSRARCASFARARALLRAFLILKANAHVARRVAIGMVTAMTTRIHLLSSVMIVGGNAGGRAGGGLGGWLGGREGGLDVIGTSTVPCENTRSSHNTVRFLVSVS